MTIALAFALAFVIVSIVMAVLYQGWTNPLVWVGWAFAVIYIIAPAAGQLP
jgi:multidrug efflux pump subunit AcrB